MTAFRHRSRLTCVLLVCLCASGTRLASQLPVSGVARDFKFPDYDKASNRVVSLLTGSEARQQPDGRMALTNLRIETYGYDQDRRTTNLVVEAPRCLVDMSRRIATSDGPLVARQEGSLFSISGTGFEWRQKDSHLVISNDVRTLVRREGLLKSK